MLELSAHRATSAAAAFTGGRLRESASIAPAPSTSEKHVCER
jgi:hypothetical protein